MSKPTLQVIIASTRPGRIGGTIGEWFAERARAHGDFEVEVVDLARVALPLLNEPEHPRARSYQHDHTKDWSATVERGDAYVLVTPEYNYSFTAPLKNALDYLHWEWQHKPVGFVSYGGVSAGTRAVQALKQVVTTLRMVPVVDAVAIPFVTQFLGPDGQLQPNEVMTAAADAMLTELAAMTAALLPRRAPVAA